MQCQQNGCEKEAVAIAHWPGQPTKQCEEHCSELNRLNDFMGAGALVFTDLTTGQTMQFTSKPVEE